MLPDSRIAGFSGNFSFARPRWLFSFGMGFVSNIRWNMLRGYTLDGYTLDGVRFAQNMFHLILETKMFAFFKAIYKFCTTKRLFKIAFLDNQSVHILNWSARSVSTGFMKTYTFP